MSDDADGGADDVLGDLIDALAAIYPYDGKDRDKAAWFAWLKEALEVRAPIVQDFES